MSDTGDNLTSNEINVGAALARIEGKLELLDERQRAGDNALGQVIDLLKQQLTFHTAELGKLEQIVRENRTICSREISAVRVDLESRLGTLDERVDSLRLSRAKATGMGLVVGVLASTFAAATLKAFGL